VKQLAEQLSVNKNAIIIASFQSNKLVYDDVVK